MRRDMTLSKHQDACGKRRPRFACTTSCQCACASSPFCLLALFGWSCRRSWHSGAFATIFGSAIMRCSSQNRCLERWPHMRGSRSWSHWDLSPGPSAFEADVMPLHHAPHDCRNTRQIICNPCWMRCPTQGNLSNGSTHRSVISRGGSGN